MSFNNNYITTTTATTNITTNINTDNRRKTFPLMNLNSYSPATVSISYIPPSRSSFSSTQHQQQINYSSSLIYYLDQHYYLKSLSSTSSSPPPPPPPPLPLDQKEILDFDKVISSQGNKTGLEM
ncbi:unnamed protein product [Cunninghamella echinulata]